MAGSRRTGRPGALIPWECGQNETLCPQTHGRTAAMDVWTINPLAHRSTAQEDFILFSEEGRGLLMNNNRERREFAGGFDEVGPDLGMPVEASEATAQLDDVDGVNSERFTEGE